MKLKGPLFSQQAQKTLGGMLEYSKRKGKNLLRFHQQPSGPVSSDQTVERAYYLEAVTAWNTLTPAEKKLWNDFNKT